MIHGELPAELVAMAKADQQVRERRAADGVPGARRR